MCKDLCESCLFTHPACIGTPVWEYSVDEEGFLYKMVVGCDAFIENSESKETKEAE